MRYKFYKADRKVIAVSSYAGRTVRGVAKCSQDDQFDIEKGKDLAEARCALKIAEKRVARADAKVEEAYVAWKAAEKYLDKMSNYLFDATGQLKEAEDNLEAILKEL